MLLKLAMKLLVRGTFVEDFLDIIWVSNTVKYARIILLAFLLLFDALLDLKLPETAIWDG